MNLEVQKVSLPLEDILEELVGEIQDEEDEEEKIVDKVGENVFWNKLHNHRRNKRTFTANLLPEDGEYNALAGLSLHELEEIPKKSNLN